MDEYVKINTIWKRDDAGVIQVGEFATPELEYLKDAQWEWTEKVDGTNVRVGWDGARVRFGGRTDDAQISVKLLDVLVDLFPDVALFERFGGDGGVVLYGEGYGAGIGRGGSYSPTQTFVLFDVKVGRWWLRREDVADVASRLGLSVVPVVARGPLEAIAETVRDGLWSAWSTDDVGFKMEGVVGRPEVELFDRAGDRIMAKIKTKDYARLAQVQARAARAVEKVPEASAAATT